MDDERSNAFLRLHFSLKPLQDFQDPPHRPLAAPELSEVLDKPVQFKKKKKKYTQNGLDLLHEHLETLTNILKSLENTTKQILIQTSWIVCMENNV